MFPVIVVVRGLDDVVDRLDAELIEVHEARQRRRTNDLHDCSLAPAPPDLFSAAPMPAFHQTLMLAAVDFYIC